MRIDWTVLKNPPPRYEKLVKIIRFLVVGGINTVFGYSLYAFLIWIGLPIEAAVLISTVLGVLFNFVSYGRLAFGGVLSGMTLARFIANYTALYFLNVWLLKLVVRAGYSAYLAAILLMPVTIIITFVSLRLFVFRGQRTPQAKP